MNIRDKYEIEETASTLAFKPFAQYKKNLKCYVLGIAVLGGLLFFYFNQIGNTLKVFGSVVLFGCGWFFLKELLYYIPIKYTFDQSANAVYQSNLLFKKRKILNLHEVVIFSSSETGSWHYSMGAKKKQFLKSYTVSEEFDSRRKSDEKAMDFEEAILSVIVELRQTS